MQWIDQSSTKGVAGVRSASEGGQRQSHRDTKREKEKENGTWYLFWRRTFTVPNPQTDEIMNSIGAVVLIYILSVGK